MALNGPIHFELTLKGSEELTARTYRLDVKLRNILFLIQKGCASFDGILQNSIFPREEVLERLRNLINEKFIALSPNAPGPNAPGPGAAPAPGAAGAAPAPAGLPAATAAPVAAPAPAPNAAPRVATNPPAAASASAVPSLRSDTRRGPSTAVATFPLLNPAASLSQARFVLGDFCLDAFGMKGQDLVERAQRASRISALQALLDDILELLRRSEPDQVAALAARIAEINDTAT